MPSQGLEIVGSYDYYLVALSVVIAILASYAALDLAGRVTSARGRVRRLWLIGGAMAMGIGMWSMHTIGMLAFHLSIPVQYDWPTVLASLLAAIFASAIALYVVSREQMGLFRATLGSLFMGGGIASMYYIGMAAMRLRAVCAYSPTLVAISVVLAVAISFVALWLAFLLRREKGSGGRLKALSAVFMGAAISAMHYTGMAAAEFEPSISIHGDLSHALKISSLGLAAIIIVTLMILGLAIITSFVDRTFSVQALELESSERRSRQILETSFDAFVGMDPAGKIDYWNAQAESTLGWPRAEVAGKVFSEMIIPEAYRQAYEAEIRQLLASSEGPVLKRRFEIMASRRDGCEIPVEITISGMGSEDSRLFAAFVRDLSERNQFENALREAKEAAEAASNAKSTFLATMSHEIRTPMNGILGLTGLVLDTDLDPEQHEYLSHVRTSAESLLSIINSILDFSKIESGKVEFQLAPFAVRQSLLGALKSFAALTSQKSLELALLVSDDVPEGLIGDESRLRQIVTNLVGNAIKFTHAGEIVVSVDLESETTDAVVLHFRVRDTGIGIPADKQSTIFDPFAQADSSITRKYGGTGLGLAISARLIELMNGRIWVESAKSHGSTFHFTAAFQATAAPGAHALAQRSQLRGIRTLVVDDNETNRMILEATLSRQGLSAILAASGEEALIHLAGAQESAAPFSLLIVDGQMPEMDGFTLVRQMRSEKAWEQPAVAMLTSAGHSGDHDLCQQLRVGAYLTKPVGTEELMEAILRALGNLATTESVAHGEPQDALRMRPLHVLLAEDQPFNQIVAMRNLEKHGHSVRIASDGTEALFLWKSEQFDLILMDVQMPEVGGYEVTAQIRAAEAITNVHIPIIAMTAYAMVGDREKCLAAGMDGYVSKPIRIAVLLQEIARVIPNVIGPSVISAPDAPATTIEKETLFKLMDEDIEILAALTEIFLRDSPLLLAQLQEAAKSQNAEKTERAAHALKGMLLGMAAETAAAHAQRIELMGRNHRMEDVNSAIAALESEFPQVLRQIGRIRSSVLEEQSFHKSS